MKKFIMFFAIMLFTASLVFGVWHIDEGFESGSIPGDWTIIDADGGWGTWGTWSTVIPPHGGAWFAMTGENYDWDGNDWLVTPQVTIESGDFFTFWARAWNNTEDFNVKLSTDGTSIGDFDVTLESVSNVGETWTEYTYDLSGYAGQQIYLAIEWLQDSYILCVDDVTVGQEAAVPVVLSSFTAIQTSQDFAQLNWVTQSENAIVGYNVYRNINNELQTAMQINNSIIAGTNTMEEQHYTFTDSYVEYEQTYYYWLESVETDLTTELYGPAYITIGNPDIVELPNATMLSSAYPNPFNPTTTIEFDIKEGEIGTFTIFNIKGQIVVSESYEAGDYTYIWNADNNASGIYFFKLQTESFSRTNKMLMVK